MAWAIKSAVMLAGAMVAAAAEAQQAPAAPTPAANGWNGEFSIGGTSATGNTQRKSADTDIRLNHREGRLEDRFRLGGTMAWEAGTTSAQRVEASAQSRFDWKPRSYTYGLAEIGRAHV